MTEERGHEVGAKLKSILLAHLAISGNGEDSFREALCAGRLITEADFTPLNGGPDGPLSRIVGWFDSLDAQEGEDNIPVLEKTGCPCADIFVRTVRVARARDNLTRKRFR